jgi:flagellar hook-associated protein 2
MGISPLRFTGISEYSSDFQLIVDRAVSIASLPIKNMQNDQAELVVKKQLLSSLGGDIGKLADAVAALADQGSTQGLAATSSDTGKVTVTLNGAADPATYVISNITSIASKASEATQTGLADTDTAAVDGDNLLWLEFDGDFHAIDLSTYGNNLEGLKEAIDDLGLGLSSSIVNSGDQGGLYHLSLSATTTGAKSLKLWTDGAGTGSNLLTGVNQGSNAEFHLNGVPVENSSNTVTGVIPGATLTIKGTTSGGTVTVDLASSRTALQAALEDFVEAFNTVTVALNAQTGENAGLLSGDSIVRHTRDLLRSMTGYRDGGALISSLTSLGIEMNDTGEMTLNEATFSDLSSAELTDAFRFLGTASTGFGAFAARLEGISDPTTGLIKKQQDTYDSTDEHLQGQIDTISERIAVMQNNLLLQLQQADVLLASLERQKSMLEASLESVTLVTYGKRED